MNKNPDLAEAESNPSSGHYYKKIGNDQYLKGQYKEAIESYTKAIEINDTETVFFSNRARCYKQLKEFKKAYDDAKSAIELDDTNIKAHLICGQMLAELGKSEAGVEKINTALSRITKALTLCAGQKKQTFEKDLNKNILKIKKLRWYKEDEIKREKKIELLNYLQDLIEREAGLTKEEKKEKIEDIIELIGNPHALFKFEVPEYMNCKLSGQLMDDPVTIQSGLTYERSALLEHLRKTGHFDPITREPISADHVYPNLNIKQSIEAFLKENPWAFEYKAHETYEDIVF